MGPYNTAVLLVNALSATYPVAVMSDGCSLGTASPDAVLHRPAAEAPRPGQASNAYAELPRHAAFLRTQGEFPFEEQRENRFFPEQYQKSQAEPIQTLLDDYLLTTTEKRAVKREREFAWYWGNWFRGQRLPTLTPAAIERARIDLQQGFRFVREKVHGQPTGHILEHYARPRSGATINRYTDWLRH